jgi:transcriptional regulator with XRE-family HTH domain
MLLHKKIRFLRLHNGWSQETMAEKLDMSPNGYGSIERGETNVQLSRVLQIAKLFGIGIAELFQDSTGKAALNSSHDIEIQNNNSSHCHFSVTEKHLSQSECQCERQQLISNLEKKIVLIEQKDKEIFLLKQINELLTAAKLIPRSVHHRRTHFINKEEPRIQEQQKENVPRFETNLSNC